MRRPRILARQLRALHTRTPPPPSVPRLRPSWSAPIPWRVGVGIPPRGQQSGPLEERATPPDATLREEAHVQRREGNANPQRPAPELGEAGPLTDRLSSPRTPRHDRPEELGSPLRDEARSQWPEGSAIPRRAPRSPRDETRPRADGEARAPWGHASVNTARYTRRAPEPYTRELGLSTLERRGPTFVHERFEALATRQCRPSGSAGVVRVALEEMLALGLKPRPAFYGAALAALAIHPDYLLRVTILEHMRKEWVESTPEHRAHNALGLLREGQYEMAMDEVDDMLATGVPVPPHLHETLVFALANLGFLDEAAAHLAHRARQHPPPRDDLHYFLLDACAAAHHHATTAHLLRATAPAGAGRLAPSDGTLLAALNTAALHADPPLALEALRRLSARRVQLSAHHFEPAVEAHARAGDLEGAVRMLCVMDAAGVRPGRDATRGLFCALRERPEDIASCVRVLERLGKAYRVPLAAVNVLLEAAIEAGDVPAAEDILGKLESLTPDAPTATTFLPFLSLASPPLPVCARAISLFPHSLSLPPDNLARLAALLAAENPGAALGYVRRVDVVYHGKADAWEVYADAVRAVAVALLESGDERAWEFVTEAAWRCPAVAAEVKEMGAAGELE